jgi:hypothetical protein
MSREAAPGYSTFEVTLPKGVNENTLALYGIGTALGWNIKERVAFASDLKRDAIPDYMEITPDDLRDISTEVWDTDVYGETAAGFLEEQKRWLSKHYYLYTYLPGTGDDVTVNSELRQFARGQGDHGSALGTYPERLRRNDLLEAQAERIEGMIGQLWPRTPYPFEAPSVRKSSEPRWETDGDKTEWWDLEAGPVSRMRLAHYARTSGIAWHSLHGSIGKAHDVINIASGLTPQERVAAKPADQELEFVDYTEFRAMLKGSGMARNSQDEVRKAIEWSLEEHIRTGSNKPWLKNPEVITDGKVEWVTRGGHRVPHPERIARVSLAHLLDDGPHSRSVAPRQFLAQFAA